MPRIIKATGYDYDGRDFIETELTTTLAPNGTVTSAGEPITLKAARQMINGYLTPIIEQLSASDILPAEKAALEESNIAVFYGKETLMLLLAQANCEGIRFYFCKNQDNKQSLVLVGIDKNQQDLGLPDGAKTLIDRNLNLEGFQDNAVANEVGGPKSLRDYLNSNKLIPDPIGEALTALLTVGN